MAHVPDRQVASPLGSKGQGIQDCPHAVASMSCTQELPQAWYPVAHVNPHLVPSQDAWEAPAGTGQTTQDGPQPVTSFAAKQKPLQGWVPVGQEPAQLTFAAMQTPSQSTLGAGHLPPHDFPSQVALPPCGTAHAVHAVPQLLMSSLRTQLPPHACSPDGQTTATGIETLGLAGGTTTFPPLPSNSPPPTTRGPSLPMLLSPLSPSSPLVWENGTSKVWLP